MARCNLSPELENLDASPKRGNVDASMGARLETGLKSGNFLIAAAQLVEAACHARDGDNKAAKERIARAIALLDGDPISSPAATSAIAKGADRHRPSFNHWQKRRLIAHVDANIERRLYIHDLAASLHVSASYFSRAFKRTFGVSPTEWITQRRIEVAQGLMLATSASLSEIAVRCGMCDQSHLSRAFRRIVGQTPHSWRQLRRGVLEIQTHVIETSAHELP